MFEFIPTSLPESLVELSAVLSVMTETVGANQFFGVTDMIVEDFTSTNYSYVFDLIFSEFVDLVARYRQITWWMLSMRRISWLH